MEQCLKDKGTNMSIDLQANKRKAIEFYKTAFMGNPSEALEKYVGEIYTCSLKQIV